MQLCPLPPLLLFVATEMASRATLPTPAAALIRRRRSRFRLAERAARTPRGAFSHGTVKQQPGLLRQVNSSPSGEAQLPLRRAQQPRPGWPSPVQP